MSNDAVNWALKQSAPSPGAKFVLFALAHEVQPADVDRCSPGMDALMALTNQAARSVTRHLGELVELGLLRRERRNIGYQERLSDVFVLSLSANMADSALPANMAHAKMAPTVTTRQNDSGQNGAIKKDLKELTTTTTSITSEIRGDVERVCGHLADRIEANGSKRPRVGPRWRMAARLLIDADGRTEDQIIKAIDWCQADTFWKSVVLSMPKLREKYDQLRLAAQRGSPNSRQQQTDQLFEAAAKRMGVI